MISLKAVPSPWYLASPYTRYPKGHVAAYLDVCRLTARLHQKYKVVFFSPIAHSHGLSAHGGLPFIDARFWRRFDAPFVDVCNGCLVAKMDGWMESDGIRDEIEDFRAQKKMIVLCDPETLELEAA